MERRREIIGPEANCDARYLNERLRAGHTVHHRYSAHMSRVHILATGGTIAGAASSDVDGSYQAGSLGIARLVAAVPGLHSLANLTWEQVSKTGSQDMHDTLWRELARRVTSIEQLPRVDILYAHASMPADLVRASVDRGAHGIVIAGMGNGNVPAEVVGMLTRVAKEDIAVVRSTRVMSGEVERNIEMSDDLMGTIAADHLLEPAEKPRTAATLSCAPYG